MRDLRTEPELKIDQLVDVLGLPHGVNRNFVACGTYHLEFDAEWNEVLNPRVNQNYPAWQNLCLQLDVVKVQVLD